MATDEELKKAFQQLHAKRAETSQNVMMTQAQIAQLKRSIKISELTEEELKGCPEETRMYRSIGRMFLQQSRDEIVKHLHEDRDESGKKVEKLEKTIERFNESLKESEERLREMVSGRR